MDDKQDWLTFAPSSAPFASLRTSSGQAAVRAADPDRFHASQVAGARGAVGLLARTVRRLRRERYDVAWLDEFHAIPPHESSVAEPTIQPGDGGMEPQGQPQDSIAQLPDYDVTCWADDDGKVQWSEDRKP